METVESLAPNIEFEFDPNMLKKTEYAVKLIHKMTHKEMEDVTNKYLAKGWTLEPHDEELVFICPEHRWIHCYNKETLHSKFIDGRWIINLKVTLGDDKQEEVL